MGLNVSLLPKENPKSKVETENKAEVIYTDCVSAHFIEEEAAEAIKQVRPFTMQNEGRLNVLYQQAVHCEKNSIQGSFVECGVWKGGAVGLMALANLKHGATRRDLHLFDSFQDLCEPDKNKDGARLTNETKQFGGEEAKSDGNLKPVVGFYDTFGGYGTLEGNRNVIENIVGYDSKNAHYHVGWFQETLPIIAPKIDKIAILRLDGDLYESMKVCLEHLYSKVVSGGFVIIDDYYYYKGCTDAVDEFIKENNIKAFLHHADYDSKYHAYWIKP